MEVKPDDGSAVDNFVVVEEGAYRMRVGEARESGGTEGSVSWMLKLQLVDGPMAGRNAVVDWLNFTDRGMHRVRSVLAALGYDTTRPVEVEPTDLLGKVATIRVETRESTERVGEKERTIRRSRVTYDGWSPDSGEGLAAEVEVGSGGGGSRSPVAADEMPF